MSLHLMKKMLATNLLDGASIEDAQTKSPSGRRRPRNIFVNMLSYSFRLHHCNFAISEADLPCGLFADTGCMGRGKSREQGNQMGATTPRPKTCGGRTFVETHQWLGLFARGQIQRRSHLPLLICAAHLHGRVV